MSNSFFSKNKNLMLFVLLLSISTFSLSKSSKLLRLVLGDAFSIISYPITYAFDAVGTFVKESYNNLLYFQEKLDEFQKIENALSEGVDITRSKEELVDEILQLREQLNYAKYLNRTSDIINYLKTPAESAKIIMRDSTGRLFNSIILNKGKEHGIKESMPVIAFQSIEELEGKPLAKIVTGKINEVSSLASKLLPINSPECIIHVRIRGSQYTGFIKGRGQFEKNLVLQNIDKRATIKIGDEIITTGGQSLFPAGIKVGVIVKDTSEELGFMKQALVRPYINFDKLQYVFIVKKELSTLKPLLDN